MVESVHNLVANRLNQHRKYKAFDYNLISSPFDKLNKNMKGFLRGELVLFASRPGMGKTTLAIQLALGFSKDYKVLFNSLDNNKDWMIDKVISQIQGLGFNSVVTGDFLKESFDLDTVNRQLNTQNFDMIFDVSDVDVLEKKIEGSSYDVLIVDWFQKLSIDNNDSEKKLTDAIVRLKKIAEKNNIAVILTGFVGWQVEERGGDKRPILSDLRCPEETEQFFDKVFMLYRADYYGVTEDMNGNSTKNLAELYLVRNKSGDLFSITLKVDDNFSCFSQDE
jgi:replicative DNA helicase